MQLSCKHIRYTSVISLFFTDNREVVEGMHVHTFHCVGSFPPLQQWPLPTKTSFRELPVNKGDRPRWSGGAECCSWFCQQFLLPKSSHSYPGMLRDSSSTGHLGFVQSPKLSKVLAAQHRSSWRHSGEETWVGRLEILSSLHVVLCGSQRSLHCLPALNLLCMSSQPCFGICQGGEHVGHVAQIFCSRILKEKWLGTSTRC